MQEHSPFCLSCLSCLLGEFGWWELDKNVPGFADQRLVRKVLWDLGQEVVDRGHVTLALQNFLPPMQHDLQRRERRTDKEVGTTLWHMLALVSEPEEKNTLLPAERPSSRGHIAVKHSLGREKPNPF